MHRFGRRPQPEIKNVNQQLGIFGLSEGDLAGPTFISAGDYERNWLRFKG